MGCVRLRRVRYPLHTLTDIGLGRRFELEHALQNDLVTRQAAFTVAPKRSPSPRNA